MSPTSPVLRIDKIQKKVVSCHQYPRLVAWREEMFESVWARARELLGASPSLTPSR